MRPRSTEVTPEQNEQLRAIARKLLEAGATQADLAEKIGMKQPNFSAFVNGKQGLGVIYAVRLMRLADVEPESFFPELAPRRRAFEYDHRYPNFALAAEFARRSAGAHDRPFIERAIELVGAYALGGQADPTPREWLASIERQVARLEFEARSPQAAAERERQEREESARYLEERAREPAPPPPKRPKR
jgi:transcriptional regulator with XRE-family HTH domain